MPHPPRSSCTAAALAAAFAVLGCTSLPSAEQMKAEAAALALPSLPADGMAMVYVVRPSALRGRVPLHVTVDDGTVPVGTTRGGEYIYFALAPGLHRIASHAENVAETYLQLKAGEVRFVRQSATVGIESALNSLASIDADVGRWHVARLARGELHAAAAMR